LFFGSKNSKLAVLEFAQLREKYISRFPVLIQPLLSNNPEPATIICILFFITSGIIFLQVRTKFFQAIAISAVLFAFWNLFSLM
jgi:hypothetical protein